MATLAGLATKLRAVSASLPTVANTAKKQVATVVLETLIESSPADTGTFISNWQVGTGAAGEIPSYSEGVKGSTRLEVSEAALAAGQAVIDATQPGEPIVVSNAVEYGKYLNDGTSSTPALGFVERALLVGNELVKGIKVG